MTTDPTTVDRVFRDHHAELLRAVAARITAPWQVIEDACQTAWVQLMRYEPDLSRPGGWLFTVAAREAIRLRERDGRELSLDRHCEEHADPPARSGLDDAVRAREALAALASLPPRQRDDLSASVAGFSYREIAERRGATYTNVNKQLARARAGVRDA